MDAIVRQILDDVKDLPPGMQREALDFVRSLKDRQKNREPPPASRESDGSELIRLMERIAARGTAFRDIQDPSAWQREIRRDRPLPGRE